MRIHLLSDVHTEFMNKVNLSAIDYLKHQAPSHTDVIVLAGDIGENIGGLIWARAIFPTQTIIYIAGNHEYYHGDLSILDSLRKVAKQKNIHFLENNSAEINGVRFLGCTLWTDYDYWTLRHVWNGLTSINDYFKITAKDWFTNEENWLEVEKIVMNDSIKTTIDRQCFHPIVSYIKHRESLAWLDMELSKPCDKQTVVVTHHAPSERSLIGSRKNSVEFAYCSRLENFIEKHKGSIDCWLHGHVHNPVDYKISGVRVASNPRGYPIARREDGFYLITPPNEFHHKLIDI